MFLAEKEGFEPSHQLPRSTPLAGAPLQPLEYFSTAEFYVCYKKNGGRSGIRTHGTLTRTPVFKTGALNQLDHPSMS